jgi:hypothetical protein
VQRPRLINVADAQESHERFLSRAVEHQSVWTVWGDTGPLIVESNFSPDDETDQSRAARYVYLFFSDAAYARRALRESWPDVPDCSTLCISLFDLLYRWLPGLHRDGHLAGTNWTGDLIGLELEPGEVHAQLHRRLPPDLRAQFREMLESTEGPQGG